ncbi:MAG: GtrA family protein [Sphingomicrobium sp.]
MRDLLDRLLSRNAAELLGRDALVSSVTFGLGLGLMWVFVEYAKIDETVSAGSSFALANSLHYAVARLWVFRGTTRGLAKGYGYFLVNAGVGLIIMVLLFAALTEWTSIHYLLARALASIVAGSVIFVLNAVFNFRRV